MKQCKLIRINDGKPQTLTNGDFMLTEEYPRTAAELEKLVNDGWQVVQMINQVSPAPQQENAPTFYMGGVLVYLERELPDTH